MHRRLLKPSESSADLSENSSSSVTNDVNNSRFTLQRGHRSFRPASVDSYNDDDLDTIETLSSRVSLESTHFQMRNPALPQFASSYQLRNMLETPPSLAANRKVTPNCESKKEFKLRFKDKEEFQIIPIHDPSISRELSPPPLDRLPPRSCLKQKQNISPILEENTVRLSRLEHEPRSFIKTIPVNPIVSERIAPSFGDETLDSDLSKDHINIEFDKKNNATVNTEKVEDNEMEKKITEKWSNRINERPETELNYPCPIDYWANSIYKRRNRRTQHINEIFLINSRSLKDHELIKEAYTTLTVLELCKDYEFYYAKCYVAGDFPMKLVVIPLRLFPDIPPLGSTWRATVEYVHVYRNQRESRFLRIAFEQTPEFLGTIKPTLSRRTITFGERKSSFYCEMLQIYAPLKHVLDTHKEILFGYFGNASSNLDVLPRLPKGIVVVEGFGWIEPKPGEIAVINKGSIEDPWLLVEPFVPTTARKTYTQDTITPSYEERLAEQIRQEKENKERIEEMLKKREEGYTLHPRTLPFKKEYKPRTAEGCYGKRDRREMCEKYLQQIQERSTKVPVFQGENAKKLFELVKNREKRGTRLGQLCHIFIDYLKDEKTFNYLKENEPENMQDFRLIVKWTVDYTKERRNCLPLKLYNFIFPLEEDPFHHKEDNWDD